ncbi:hypothetical protein H0H81_010671 [Sphagnurus paluster]|uniref:Mitochondrial splicing suppressor 51-like C-terminal domain-containing protein n=1 Tax=Sphagnurus paluster TaxID=117069 RepID=A0A9P7FRC9_9AGAR|nr:hypothetical protein H0H81_010671 [Sphagnurus paluster]
MPPADWKSHKPICKALRALEINPMFQQMLTFALPDKVSTVLKHLEEDIKETVFRQKYFLQEEIKRKFERVELTAEERDLIGWEPRCMACGRTDRIIRMQAAYKDSSSSRINTLKSCQNCKMAFYCSARHWEAVRERHAEQPCEDGHDGLTQCIMNQAVRVDAEFSIKNNIRLGANMGEFRWAPERDLPAWISLKNTNWESEYADQLMTRFGVAREDVAPYLRAVSVTLSMPMTILAALEQLNSDDKWTRKETLTIHVIHILGAFEAEFHNGRIFEEILHRLPLVKNLKAIGLQPYVSLLILIPQLVLCGPELSGFRGLNYELNMDTCRNCSRKKRKMIRGLFAQTYHEYARNQGKKFTIPDLAVAFNSGSSQECVKSWEETMEFLVKKKITTVFTGYNREEAEAEGKLLQEAGAQLVPGLGPREKSLGKYIGQAGAC